MSKSFCKKPFNHIYVHTNGKMRLCCNTSENVVTNNNYNLFDIRKNSLNEYWNSQSIKNVRMNMLNDLPVAACKSCYDSEAVGYSSPREFQEKEIFQHLTDKNGFLNEKPKSLQIQFGNQCNLMCKMCSQDYSHMQGAEIKDMIDNDKSFGLWIRSQGGNVNNWLYNLGEKQLWFQDKALKENIFSYISENISHLRILGGEPFIIKSFFELLKYMEEKNTIQNKKINITSNCTVIHHNYLKILQKTKSFQIWCSIDGINERNSYIRYPSEWNVIQENLHTIKKYLRPQDSMSVHPATQILNIDQLDEIVEWWLDFYGKPTFGWSVNVFFPKIFNYDIAPLSYKKQCAEKLKKFNFQDTYYQNHIKNLLIDKEQIDEKKKLLSVFVKFNDYQDKYRGLQIGWRKLLPKLEEHIENFIDH